MALGRSVRDRRESTILGYSSCRDSSHRIRDPRGKSLALVGEPISPFPSPPRPHSGCFQPLGILVAIGLLRLQEPASKASIFLLTVPLLLVVFALLVFSGSRSQHSQCAIRGPSSDIWWPDLRTAAPKMLSDKFLGYERLGRNRWEVHGVLYWACERRRDSVGPPSACHARQSLRKTTTL